MIYQFPTSDDPIDQGDIFDGCPIVQIAHFDRDNPTSPKVACSIQTLREAGDRKARIQPLYREHLARHFADTYSRIGLPQPYETE